MTELLASLWRYSEAVPSIQVKNVPDDVHETMRRRARESGRSLQEYMLHRLCREARTPTVEELMARVADRSGGNFSLEEATALVRDERDAR